MGYRIRYSSVKSGRRMASRVCGIASLTGLMLMLFVAITVFCWPDGNALLRDLLFSGRCLPEMDEASWIQDLRENLSTWAEALRGRIDLY